MDDGGKQFGFMDSDSMSLGQPSGFLDMLAQRKAAEDKRQSDLKMMMFLHRQHNPKATLDDAVQLASQMMYQKDMKDTLMGMHFNMNNFNMKQRRELGIQEKPGEYVHKFNGLQDLWKPRPELWM